MIPKECKRLAEVDFPIAVVSKHSAKEKSIRHGHPSTLHLWWARRPLAACRSMLLGLLLPDPCDEHCPADFKKEARKLLPKVVGTVGAKDENLRQALLRFIGDFADWNLSSHPTYLEVGRRLVKAAHPEETPLVVDPFAGGGSIPLEALRLGCDAFSSDLNPVACLIQKVLLEDIPRHGPELVDELRRVGEQVKKAAEKELSDYYPPDPDGARPIAYIWARTVRCESPKCGAEIPLARSFWLSKKAGNKRALRYKRIQAKGQPPEVQFEVVSPKSDGDVPKGTVSRAKATCPCCGVTLGPDRIRAQLREQRGGADVIFDRSGNRVGGSTLLAVVTLKADEPGRFYRESNEADYAGVREAQRELKRLADQLEPDGLSVSPDEPLPSQGTLGFRVQLYGMTQWGDIFSARQKLTLVVLTRLLAAHAVSPSAGRFLALAFSRLTDIYNALCQWENTKTQVRHLFTRQAIPMLWDFAEASATGEQAGDFSVTLGTMIRVMERIPSISPSDSLGQIELGDACASPLSDESAACWFTDPPYYDAIPYSDLSDFFLVWLKRALPGSSMLRDPFDYSNPLSPKTQEAVQDETKQVNGKAKDRAFFEETMARAFTHGRRVLRDDGIGSVVFAHKTTEGWEALLAGMSRAGWTITGSWPIATESGTRLRARDSAALATSVHLVCRPRPGDAGIGDWAQAVRELPKRVGDWMERLQREGVRGADLVFACIGPALEIYSRYEKVVDAEEREIPLGGDPEAKEPHLRGYLAYVWEVVGRLALEQVLGTAEAKARNGAAGALEEDSRLTALFLWTMQSTDTNAVNGSSDATGDADDDEPEEDDEPVSRKKGGFSLPFDVVRRFAQPLGIHLPEWERRIIETEKGVVRLLPIADRASLLFGDDGADAVAEWLRSGSGRPQERQMFLFGEEPPVPKSRGKKRAKEKAGQNVPDEALTGRREATTLDRVHMAMLLQSSGRTNALRALLNAEQERGPDFVRLSNALSALYPGGSEEKRLLDAMLLAVPR
jgi:adenine-specific DNA methylase